MLPTLKRLVPLLIVFVLLAAALPAAAQTNPEPPQRPAPGQLPPMEQRAFCLPIGLALAVLSQDGTVADILPAPRDPQSIGGTAREIVLPGPTAVGACAEFQGFWGPGASGTAAAMLVLYQVDPTGAGASLTTPVARDGLEETKRGPATHQASLKALTKLEKPGKYHFVAALQVSAEGTPTAAAVPAKVEDSLRVPFTIVINEKPDEQPLGAIEGTVATIAADGTLKPLAGAVVMAMPAVAAPRPLGQAGAGASTGASTGASLVGPIGGSVGPLPSPVVVLGGEIGAADPGRVVTDEKGHYILKVPAGRYAVSAVARGFQPQYFKGKLDPREADPVGVKPGETAGGVDFELLAAEAPKPPEPQPEPQPKEYGVITGLVMGPDGPIEGALVTAVPPRNPIGAVPNPGSAAGSAVRTGADGTYKLKVEVGKWMVTAAADGYKPQWFKGQDEPQNAELIAVTAGSEAEDVDFSLARLTITSISGTVIRSGTGAIIPVGGATVIAVLRPPNVVDPVISPVPTFKAVTDRDGKFTIVVPPGTYAVGLIVGPASNTRDPVTIWWDKKTKIEDADLITVAEGDAREGIDFAIPPSTTP